MKPLEGAWIALSGAVPDLEDMDRYGWSELDIRFAVVRLVERVVGLGGGIIHGSRPSFTPLVEEVASEMGEPGKRVRMLVSRHFVVGDDAFQRFRARHEPYADIAEVPSQGGRDPSLTALRQRLVRECAAMVVIGGRLHAGTGSRPGAEEEATLAMVAGRPLYLLGSFGGYAARALTRVPDGHIFPKNGLSDQENQRLATDRDAGAALALVAKGLVTICGRM